MTELALPSDWSSKRLKYLATYNDGVLSESTDEEKEIDYVEISGVSLSRGIEEIERLSFGQAPSRARRKVRTGDILISTVRTYLRAIAMVDEASPDLIASTGFCVVRPKDDVDRGFLGWAAKSEPFVSEVVARSVGVSYPAINASELVTIDMPLPPPDTQRRIARFLDEKTARIDGLIEKKRALFDRLAEQRQALITFVVTKGLDPDAPMKGSGIDWIGEIPAHWEVLSLNRIIRMRSGDFIAAYEIESDGKYLVFGGNGVRGFTEDFNTIGPIVLIGRQGAHCGNVQFAYGKVWVSEHALRCLPEKKFEIRWLAYMLETMNLNQHSVSAAQPGLSVDNLKHLLTTLPPLNEQRNIANQLDVHCCHSEEIAREAQKSLNLLEEYRSALITAAVTGRLAELR